MEDRPYVGTYTHTFLDVFRASNFDEHSLLCELFFHIIFCENISMYMVATVLSYMGDVQLHVFISFMKNQIEWHPNVKSMETNEKKTTLWIREELGRATELRREFKFFLSTPGLRE